MNIQYFFAPCKSFDSHVHHFHLNRMSKGDEDFHFHFHLKVFKLFDMFDCSSSSVRELHLHIGWLQLPEVVSGKSGKLAVAPEFTSATHSPHSVGKMGRGRVLKPQLSPWSSVVTQRAQHEGEQQGERQKHANSLRKIFSGSLYHLCDGVRRLRRLLPRLDFLVGSTRKTRARSRRCRRRLQQLCSGSGDRALLR